MMMKERWSKDKKWNSDNVEEKWKWSGIDWVMKFEYNDEKRRNEVGVKSMELPYQLEYNPTLE